LRAVRLKLSENALRVLENRYLKKDDSGKVIESPEEMFERVARAIAEVDLQYGATGEEVEKLAEQFYELMGTGKFLPNSPTLMNAGTPMGQLSACFVLPVEDSMEGIFETVKQAAIIHKTGGGTGFSFSRLRPTGDIVKSTGGVASGPVSFMKVFNAATEAVKQGGRRRGANMGMLRIDHPDILEFITCKDDVTEITNFNISVSVTDDFMKRYFEGADYPLINPRTGKPVRTLSTKEVFDKIVYQAWKNGEPGMVFIDRINKTHTLRDLGEIEATNPCVTGDTWILTPEGPAQVRDVLNKQISLALNGSFHQSTERGFFKTGVKNVLLIRTQKGYELKVTEDHLIRTVEEITRYRVKSVWKKAGELRPGDKIVLSNNRHIEWEGKGTFEEGYLLGLLLGDGTLKKEGGEIKIWGKDEGALSMMQAATQAAFTLKHRKDFQGFKKVISSTLENRLRLASLRELAIDYGIFPGKKRLTEKLEKTSYQFYRGFLRGLFDADGTVIGSQNKGVSVRLWQKDLNNLKIVQRMLHRLGIISSIYENRKSEGIKLLPDGKGGYKKYRVEAGHELVITKDNLLLFSEIIGFSNNVSKQNKLTEKLALFKRKLNRERFVTSVLKIVPKGREEVFDVEIPFVNAYDANGFYIHNCGEKPLLPYESCNLGSVNVASFFKGKPWYLTDSRTAKFSEVRDRIDWKALKHTVELSVHFLDNVVDLNQYPLPQIRDITLANRKIGLGIMGFADLLYQLGIPYSSKESLKAAEEIMKFIQEVAHQKSIELGAWKGPFPNIEKSIFKETTRRNAVVTTIAPTGTISMIADTSPGIEPNFSLVYVKRVLEGQSLLFVNKYLKEAAEELGFWSNELFERLSRSRSIKKFDEIPRHIRDIFETTFDVSPEQHVRIQASFQKYVEDAVSKTINLPNKATPEDVAKAYLLAYKLGCKGITVYRDGSRPTQVMDVKEKKGKERQTPGSKVPRPRPLVTRGKTYKTVTDLGSLYITINEDDQGPFEVFVHLGKSGSSSMAFTEAIGRLISLALRSGVSPRAIIKQLFGIKSSTPVRQEDGQVVFSVPDAIAKVLEKHLAGGKQLSLKGMKSNGNWIAPLFIPGDNRANGHAHGKVEDKELSESLTMVDLCPECGGKLEFIEGCYICRDCGYSKCE